MDLPVGIHMIDNNEVGSDDQDEGIKSGVPSGVIEHLDINFT